MGKLLCWMGLHKWRCWLLGEAPTIISFCPRCDEVKGWNLERKEGS